MIVEFTHRNQHFRLHDETHHTAWVLSELHRWEVDTFDTIDRYVRGGAFVDIGAWIGLFTIYAAPKASWVYAFEPDPVARDMLHRNLELNAVNNVTVVPAAVWSHDGTVELFENGELGDSMTGPTREGPSHTFDCVSVETVRQLAGDADLVKLDTEGSERFILPSLIEWPVPLHVSVHIPQLDGAHLSFGDRPAEIIAGDKAYYTVLVL